MAHIFNIHLHTFKKFNIMENHKMKTLSECITTLKKYGFEHDFLVTEDGQLKAYDGDKTWNPEDVEIENFYRFEGQSDPSDNSILYALITKEGFKGTLSHPYGGVGGDENAQEFIKQIEAVNKKDHGHSKEE